jgi:hypothetical protein
MTVAGSTARRRSFLRIASPAPVGPGRPRRRRAVWLVLVNVLVFSVGFLIAEVAFRLFWNPRYWIHADRWLIGSGQTEVGKKWWPSTTYRVDGSEFRTEFRTNSQGYRARPEPITVAHPYRIALVGDSFTEAIQVPYEASFCARLERLLNQEPDASARPKVCDNYGVSATDLFDYWHRIVHDVLTDDPPDALVLCVYPGNDFQPTPPADGFDADGRPLRDYFRRPGFIKHLIAWINLHSEFGFFLQRSLLSWDANARRPDPRLKNWWTDPRIAANVEDEPAVKRYRSLFRAIDQECRRCGTKLGILVVGPVANYAAKDGQSPLARILARWQIAIPVIDIAIRARARRDWASLVFPFDGHLNVTGHDYLANEAVSPLRAFFDGPRPTTHR